ncbi:NAD(P)-binding domain-containing protein [archaeon]|jgi:thioredoxin reductase|nr:NAD(P)-binding domain-containing protein [archaeon]MBT4352108.1 NAD(P)-binding domain-containing protein [archaeon]MBT4648302.1 NAD(P)-binding domain-containing protein [archaeon]
MVKFTIGDKSPLPALKKNFESENIKNLFVIGSLSGIPLIKNAINQGKDVIDEIKPNSIKKEADFDLIIVGGGPGGVTAAIEAKKKGLNYILLEKGRLFEIVHQYPNKKPIYAEPHELKVTGDLNFEDKPKEKLLEDLAKKIKKNPINIIENNPVSDIKKKGDLFFIKSKNKNYTSEFVILSIGDLGSPRKLKISGEDLDIVSHKLDNPDKYFDKKILVVGGGNSAIEAAIALSEKNKVILSYRQDSFFRCTKKIRIYYKI